LGPGFTRRELDAARRRLVRHLHPDHQHGARASVRRAREDALKRINAAYDNLRSEAR
jgi:curved DNA-binding protein CbpA